MPHSCAMHAMFAPFLCSRSQPVRILRVTGTSTAFTTASRMRATSVSSVSKAEPHSLPHTFFAGHPMFRSMICAPRVTLARANVTLGAQIIDLNMGCPAKKVCGRLCGSALLTDETLVARILEAVVNAVDVPVTLKIRTGWDREHRNGANIA